MKPLNVFHCTFKELYNRTAVIVHCPLRETRLCRTAAGKVVKSQASETPGNAHNQRNQNRNVILVKELNHLPVTRREVEPQKRHRVE